MLTWIKNNAGTRDEPWPAQNGHGEELAAIGFRSKPCPARRPLLLLDGLEIVDDRAHVLGLEDEFRHVWMTGRKALRQGLGKTFDLESVRERAEGRCRGMRARAGAADGMAAATIGRQQFLAMRGRRAAFFSENVRHHCDR